MRQTEYSSRWPLTGRENELSRMLSHLARRHIDGVVIYGAEGVGKTRLVKEFAYRAARQGYRCDRIYANSLTKTIPLGALAHLLPANFNPAKPLAVFHSAAANIRDQRRRRLILVVDDMHNLDSASTILLTQLVDAGLIFLVGTIRPSQTKIEVRRMLDSRESISRIYLSNLDHETTADVLSRALAGVVDGRTVFELHKASDGNILFLHELTDQAVNESKLIRERDGVWHLRAPVTVPQRLHELVARRIDETDPAQKSILHLLALSGPTSVKDLESISGSAALMQMEDDGLIETHASGRRITVDLAHPIYREVIAGRLSDLQAREILQKRLSSLESYGHRRSEDSLVIVSLRLATGQPADPKLILRAAEFARFGHDYERVISLLALLPRSETSLGSQLLLGEALYELGKFQEADAVFIAALERCESEEERVAVTIERTQNLAWGAAVPEQGIHTNSEILRNITDPGLRRSLKVNEGAMRILAGRPKLGLQLIEDNLSADLHDRIALYGAGLTVIGMSAVGTTEEAVRVGQKNSVRHKEASQKVVIQHSAAALSALSLAYMAYGDLEEARSTATEGYTRAVAEKAVQPSAWLAFDRARCEWLAGRLKTAYRWFARSLFMAKSNNLALVAGLAESGMRACGVLLNEPAPSTEDSGMAVRSEAAFLAGETALGRAWALATEGSMLAARSILLDAASQARSAEYFTSEMLLLTEVARLGGAVQAVDRLAQLGDICDGPFAQARKSLAIGMATTDPELLLSVSASLEKIGANLLAAEAAAAAARMLQRRNKVDVSAYAVQTVARLTAHCECAATPGLSLVDSPQPLTERELEIAYIASRGSSSKEIADTLALSVRTVDNHLHRVYGKLGITSRRQIAPALRAMDG
nr:LuxR family transcriptional regulator [Streptomyces chartreusis]